MPPRPRTPFRLLICPNAFKGTLSPSQAAAAMAEGISAAHPAWKTRCLPVADGGDGTLDVFLSVFPGRRRQTRVRGPLGKPVIAEWGLLSLKRSRPRTAIIEMARASGLALVKGRNNIMRASSFGTGQLIKKALDEGAREIYIGVGGTATGEGGAGALEALGLKFYDSKKRRLRPIPEDLINLNRIDLKGMDPRLKKTKLWILCDVKNPLLGKRGSARTFGPQKGASPSQVKKLEGVLEKLNSLAPRDRKSHPGAGAAGALAWGLAAFAGGRLTPGTDQIFKAIQFRRAVQKADALLTGEGRIDLTSFSGKAVGAVRNNALRRPVYAIAGSSSISHRRLRLMGIRKTIFLGPRGLTRSRERVKKAAKEIFSAEI